MQNALSDSFLRRFDAVATQHGFFAWGATEAREVQEYHHFRTYLARGYHADMHFLKHNEELRKDPRKLVPGARSVLVFLRSYAHTPPPLPQGHVQVAAYARGLDYHASMKRDLKALAGVLEGYRTRVFVDTAPLLERYWARRAGIASLGKNGSCLRRDAGSAFFIGIILTDASFPQTDDTTGDLCGDCDRCLRSCPTHALIAPHVLDARRCVSYLTIEHRGAISPEYRPALGCTVFGCDICQDACPYNESSSVQGHDDFAPQPPFDAPALNDLLAMTPQTFQTVTRDRVLSRAGWEGLTRNALIVAANLHRWDLLRVFASRQHPHPLRIVAQELLKQGEA